MRRCRFNPWYGCLALLAVIVVVLGIGTAVDQRIQAEAAAADAQNYTPPPIASPTSAPVVAFIGDSYTQGVGATSVGTRFESLVAGSEGWNAVDEGRGGTGYLVTSSYEGCGVKVCPNYQQMIPAVKAVHPSIVVVSGGRNDVASPDGEVHAAVKKFFTTLHEALPNAKVYVTSPIWDATTPPNELDKIAGYVSDSARSIGATYLDIGEPLKGHADWFGADHVHPNDLGHAAIARSVEAALHKAT